MAGRTLGLLVFGLVVGVLAFGLWYQSQYPRRIVGEGRITVPSRGGGSATLRTREVDIAGKRFSEVELPNGTWIDCSGDCGRAAREAGDEFWRKIERDRH